SAASSVLLQRWLRYQAHCPAPNFCQMGVFRVLPCPGQPIYSFRHGHRGAVEHGRTRRRVN
ncbi:unnamed protein product, partial [Mycena citricolor]